MTLPPSVPPLIFFDLEGTLLRKCYELDKGVVAPSAWALLARELGEDCLREEEETQIRWSRGGYTGYVEWMRDTIRIHQKYGLTKCLFDKVMDSVELHPGVQEVLDELRHRGAKTAVISGGFKALGDKVQRALKIDHAFCGCEYFFNAESGLIDHFNLLPSDVEGKVDFMLLLVKEYGFQPRQCAFIGDGKNDVALAQSVGYSIAFNAQAELRAASSTAIDQARGEEDFKAVLGCLQRAAE